VCWGCSEKYTERERETEIKGKDILLTRTLILMKINDVLLNKS
jgi:hypothetical protein